MVRMESVDFYNVCGLVRQKLAALPQPRKVHLGDLFSTREDSQGGYETKVPGRCAPWRG